MRLIIRWLLLAAALLLVTHLYRGVTVSSFGDAMLAAFVIGLFNTLVRPLLVLLTLPVTLLTLGLFLFVINALMFWWAASVLDGFNVTGFGAALLGSLIYSLCSMVIDAAMERVFNRRRRLTGQVQIPRRHLTCRAFCSLDSSSVCASECCDETEALDPCAQRPFRSFLSHPVLLPT